MSGNTTADENGHLFVWKRFLNVPILTPYVMVYGDTGIYELYNNIQFCLVLVYNFENE